jgi:hypothetical protein
LFDASGRFASERLDEDPFDVDERRALPWFLLEQARLQEADVGGQLGGQLGGQDRNRRCTHGIPTSRCLPSAAFVVTPTAFFCYA